MKRYHLPALLFSLLFCSCATQSFQMTAHESDSQWSGTAILLDYDMVNNSDNCTLIFRSPGIDRDYNLTLSGKKHTALVDLPAGTYYGKTLSCSNFKKWDLDDFLKGHFTIEAEKINYLGKVSFVFSPDLSSMTIKKGDQGVVTKSILSDLDHISDGWKKYLFNPFTHQPIDPGMLVKKSIYRMDIKTTYYTKKGESGPSTKSLEADLNACDEAEQNAFPYRLGTLTFTATYESEKLTDLKKENHHSFSDGFTACIEKSFGNFTPAKDTKFKVVVSI